MNVLIDARSSLAVRKIFSLTLLERLLRQLDVAGVRQALVMMPPGRSIEAFLRPEFRKQFTIAVTEIHAEVSLESVIGQVLTDAPSAVVLEADGIYDERILTRLMEASHSMVITNQNPDPPVATHLFKKDFQSKSLKETLTQPSVETVHTSSMPSYIRFIRKSIEPVLLRITESTDLRALEDRLYENTFKSGMELIAIYGYRIPVRALTRWAAGTFITPNMVTGLATICKVGAVPLFFLGYLGWGLALAAGFIVLDSLDGKLARMTFRFSETADKVDHLTTLPARIGWNLGMTWHFSQGDWFSPPAIAGLIATVVPFLDDVNWVIVKTKFHKSLYDFTDLDTFVHLFTVKRNDIALLVIATAIGHPLIGFYGVAMWTVLTWIWHVIRTFQIVFVLAKKYPELVKR